MSKPFGIVFGEERDSNDQLPAYNADTQTVDATDAHLQQLAASENTLTFTAGRDNDFDD